MIFSSFQLILNAKCHAIRDAQLIEKVEIKKELLTEDKRLDEMMEVERIKALQEYEEREKKRQQERLDGAKVLRDQIKDNLQNKMLEEERKDQETSVSVVISWLLCHYCSSYSNLYCLHQCLLY